MKERLRFVTAASLFDGHDASINIIRRLLQAQGVEVIHLGHNRSAMEVVRAAIQEDAHALAISSYQGGHIEYFKYVRDLLNQANANNVRIFGGGGGVITPNERQELHDYGITKIYGPEEGTSLGLEGIIRDMVQRASFSSLDGFNLEKIQIQDERWIGKIISHIENGGKAPHLMGKKTPLVLGITGTGGAGKSSLIDELFLRIHSQYPEKRVALISVDPTKKRTQGALLGDRIRLNSASFSQFFVRSLATRSSGEELSPYISETIHFLKTLDFDLIIVETSGIGQSSDAINKVADKTVYVMTPEYGAPSQLEKIEMLDSADVIVLNKFERPRAEDALRDIRKQYRRNKNLFGSLGDHELPIYPTIASRFNDLGVNKLWEGLELLVGWKNATQSKTASKIESEIISGDIKSKAIIPADRANYLREISQKVKEYHQNTENMGKILKKLSALETLLTENESIGDLKKIYQKTLEEIPPSVIKEVQEYLDLIKEYDSGVYSYLVRGKEVKVQTKYESLSHQMISRVSFPKLDNKADIFKFIRTQNLPGFFPFAGGIFPFKRKDEDPKRQFAGEGGPNRTNKRFHYLSEHDEAKRLSTAFDSVTLYGEDPDTRPDIFGKIGESGVSICTLDDMEELYKGFDLCSPKTSVSMTINGPAPIILAMYMNAAIRQKLKEGELWDKEKRLEIMRSVRGTVQADILKEDQAQNTCIFSLEFALKMMGDVQEFFSKNNIKNYYTVSISGYHIAEAGANPITQLAFTLANGFTYVEYYLSRGLKIDEFAENLSFFFSNGLDPEYTVMGHVARRIWAIAMRDRYGANINSQKLKYHIQTSGRSLHAQEIDFNDIRTTLQAFLALSDNCNSLHTNAYDEAITTPTEESVRRAMAIQMIINREFGLNKSDNPLQGSYLFQELAEIVEIQVLEEFERISDKGGVLGAMEVMYQRSKIQEESLYYETKKDSGELPIIGVNTYINPKNTTETNNQIALSRSSKDEKMDQIRRLDGFKQRNKAKAQECLKNLQKVCNANGNIFEELLIAVNHCSLGEITKVLYEVGGRYRRNM